MIFTSLFTLPQSFLQTTRTASNETLKRISIIVIRKKIFLWKKSGSCRTNALENLTHNCNLIPTKTQIRFITFQTNYSIVKKVSNENEQVSIIFSIFRKRTKSIVYVQDVIESTFPVIGKTNLGECFSFQYLDVLLAFYNVMKKINIPDARLSSRILL